MTSVKEYFVGLVVSNYDPKKYLFVRGHPWVITIQKNTLLYFTTLVCLVKLHWLIKNWM